MNRRALGWLAVEYLGWAAGAFLLAWGTGSSPLQSCKTAAVVVGTAIVQHYRQRPPRLFDAQAPAPDGKAIRNTPPLAD